MKKLLFIFLFIILLTSQFTFAKSCDGGGTSFRGGGSSNNSVKSNYNTNRTYRSYSNQSRGNKPNSINGVQIIGN